MRVGDLPLMYVPPRPTGIAPRDPGASDGPDEPIFRATQTVAGRRVIEGTRAELIAEDVWIAGDLWDRILDELLAGDIPWAGASGPFGRAYRIEAI